MTPAEMAAALENTGRYRVFDVYRQRDGYGDLPAGATVCRLLYVDTETIGLEHDAEIIELAAVQVEYDPLTGRLSRILAAHSWLEQSASGAEVPAEVTALTGITTDMVAGQRIDDTAVLDLLAASNLVVSHNASFDRPKLEARLPAFAARPWACTAVEIDWKAEGIGSAKLDYVAFRMGFIFAGAHRGEVDCLAGVEVLSRTLPVTGTLAMASLLARARMPTLRVWAIGSPFDAKDALKRRGYRWNDGSIPGSARAWYRDLQADDADAELDWLRTNAGCPGVPVRLTAQDRHAARAMLIPTG